MYLFISIVILKLTFSEPKCITEGFLHLENKNLKVCLATLTLFDVNQSWIKSVDVMTYGLNKP